MVVVPIIKAVDGLRLMLEVRNDKALVEDLHLLLVNDTVARRNKLNAFHLCDILFLNLNYIFFLFNNLKKFVFLLVTTRFLNG
jgi:hypothetical protein